MEFVIVIKFDRDGEATFFQQIGRAVKSVTAEVAAVLIEAPLCRGASAEEA